MTRPKCKQAHILHIAAPPPGGQSTWSWLCEEHKAKKLAEGWTVLEDKGSPPHLGCQECK